MLNLTINDKLFKLPSDWEELTLRQFIDILILKKDEKNSDLDNFVKTLGIFAGDHSIEESIMDLDVSEFNQIKDAFEWIKVDPQTKSESKDFFEFEGKKFTMKKDYNQLTVGEAITVELLLKDQKVDLDPLEISFAVLFREVIDGKMKPFNADTMYEMLNDYSNRIKIVDVYEVITFFLSGEKSSFSKPSKVSLSIEK